MFAQFVCIAISMATTEIMFLQSLHIVSLLFASKLHVYHVGILAISFSVFPPLKLYRAFRPIVFF